MTNNGNDNNDLLAGFGEEGMGLGDTVATALADVVAATPGLINSTTSAIDPATVKAAKVGVVQIVFDDSDSMTANLVTVMGAGHDTFVDALKPAASEGVAILISAIRLSGQVVYSFRHVADAPRFGREPQPGEQLIPGMNLSYAHMPYTFPVGGNTPLRDRMREMTVATLAEGAKYDNPRINREADVTVIAMTDGLDMGSKVSLTDYTAFAEELGDTGRVTYAVMYVGKVLDPGQPGYEAERSNILHYLKRREERGELTRPANFATMTLRELLFWYFGMMGIREDRVFLPGMDGKAIRRAVGQMSQLALQASKGALRGDSDYDDETETATPTP
jgi:hypothetical protein